ncbi:MOSC domain-containing protein [Thalassospira marina]|uniref:MOSC domain-containing protein n=1 Tax=Thalassospira marina TaxID=2048283 RepID=A0A2N3KD70_9PROT|nr:MOSC domain-containing protein [Thalassospira marina]PKR48495.1 MOSC domain-containing protein [Thalassospira marina]
MSHSSEQQKTVGELCGIGRKAAPRAPVETLQQVSVSTELGVDGDHRGKVRRRKVTVLALEDWQAACNDIARPDLDWTVRRANLLVSGFALPHEVGARIGIGDLVLEVSGETDPCKRMEEAATGLEEALRPDWRGGVTCRVIEGADIALGAPVRLLPAE